MRTPTRSIHRMNAALATVIALAFVIAARADVLHVPADFPTIQAAIDAASSGGGDEIVVAPGTYFENINLLGKAVHLRSSDGPEETIIDGMDVAAVITCVSGEGPETIIEGFTVRNEFPTPYQSPSGSGLHNIGASPTLINCRFIARDDLFDNWYKGGGWGIYNEGGNLTVIDCTFTMGYHTAASGGGMYNIDAGVTITGGDFSYNRSDGLDGALRNINTSVAIAGTQFLSNGSHVHVGAIISMATAGAAKHVTLEIADSTFIGNWSGDPLAAGAIHAASSSTSAGTTLTPANCFFENNTEGAISGAGTVKRTITGSSFIGHGSEFAAVHVGGDDLVEDCVFIDNSAVWQPAALSVTGNATVVNCTFIGNTSWHGAGAVVASGTPTFLNCIFEGNSAVLQWGGDPNEHTGGLLAISGDVHVGGSAFCDNPGGHIYGPWTNLGGNTFGLNCPVGDLTGDGVVGITDLLELLAQWGACDECAPGDSAPCPADLDGDCNVGVSDLLVLLANWG